MDVPGSFGFWLRRRRKTLDVTWEKLAQCAGCSVAALCKIEADERRPSRQLAQLLAECLEITPDDRATFLQIARSERRVDDLSPATGSDRLLPLSTATLHPMAAIPVPPLPLLGRKYEEVGLAELLQDPQCQLPTLTGPGGIGKTRLALEAGLNYVTSLQMAHVLSRWPPSSTANSFHRIAPLHRPDRRGLSS